MVLFEGLPVIDGAVPVGVPVTVKVIVHDEPVEKLAARIVPYVPAGNGYDHPENKDIVPEPGPGPAYWPIPAKLILPLKPPPDIL